MENKVTIEIGQRTAKVTVLYDGKTHERNWKRITPGMWESDGLGWSDREDADIPEALADALDGMDFNLADAGDSLTEW